MNEFIDFISTHKETIGLGLIVISYGVIKLRSASKKGMEKSLAQVIDEIADYGEENIDKIVDNVYSLIPLQFKLFVSKKIIKVTLLKIINEVEEVVENNQISAEGIIGDKVKTNTITKG